jgi:hypothetical protein
MSPEDLSAVENLIRSRVESALEIERKHLAALVTLAIEEERERLAKILEDFVPYTDEADSFELEPSLGALAHTIRTGRHD